MKHYALTIALILISRTAHAGPVEQPEGWGVQYEDASCIVHTESAGASPRDPDWKIKMGYLSGNQLIFIFSAQNYSLRSLGIPANSMAWLVVDGKDFRSLGISAIDGELIVSAENGLALQRALATARKIGAKIQTPSHASPVDLMDFSLFNIPGAIEWLGACNMVGIGALPD